jgi:hypothetical protein
MSLIQDALKRKSEETGDSRPPEIPVEILELPTEGKKNKLRMILPLILLLTAFLAAPLGFSIYLTKPKQHVPAPAIVKNDVSIAPVSIVPITTPEPVAVPAAPAPVIVPPSEPAKVEPAKTEPVAEPVKNEEPAPAAQIVWPELKLTGIAQSGNQSIAILNGKMLITGRKLGEVLVKEVHETDVIVEYLGERRVLYINE